MKRCPNCSAMNADEDSQCIRCGSHFAEMCERKACPSCGSVQVWTSHQAFRFKIPLLLRLAMIEVTFILAVAGFACCFIWVMIPIEIAGFSSAFGHNMVLASNCQTCGHQWESPVEL
ncbi:MAG: hypothetical protein K8R88_05880 [Armatimonadetes bacterium]|nr:hypothetical protein [Armatimonadota bacterium]